MKNHNKDKKRGRILFDYDAQEEDEVSIRSGEVFHLDCAYDDGWWLVTVHGEQGMIPSNYAQLEEGEDDDNESPKTMSSPDTTTATTTTQETNREQQLLLGGEGQEEEEQSPKSIKPKFSAPILSNRSSRPSLEIEEDGAEVEEETPRLQLDVSPRVLSEEGEGSQAEDHPTRPSSALERLMVLREETTAKIDKLR